MRHTNIDDLQKTQKRILFGARAAIAVLCCSRPVLGTLYAAMGAANGTQFRLVDAEVELRRETRDFARCEWAEILIVAMEC